MLRPVLFKIVSTTQLKITFNELVSTSIGIDNFKVESVSGSDLDLEIISVQIDNKSIILNTRPHKAKAYYVIKLLDSPSAIFESDKGNPLINDDLSRDIYFIGIEKANQIRDDIFYKTPPIYNLDGSLVNSILSTQADNILAAQHSIGSLLNDNYISQEVRDEYRVRGAGSSDRLANENAYQITRVSTLPTGSSILRKTIEIDSTDIYPINLRQELVENFSINQNTDDSSFIGFLVSLPYKGIIKVSYAKLIKSSDVEDCDGNIGTEYNLNKFKYSLLTNRYDQENCYVNHLLESNQVLFSDFGNWSRPEPGDTIIISYYYDNASISIINDSIDIYETVNVINESIPSNAKTFTLKNGMIIDSFDEISELGGVTFKSSENSNSIPLEFSNELIYNFSTLPSKVGEYSINYETGDVFLVGSEPGNGTGYNYFFADYRYKKIYKNDLDYSIFNNELNLNYLRPVFGKNIKISFDYELVFAEGTDYNSLCHKEVLGESVQNRVTSSFSLTAKNGPITDVFRIFNQTTGEVYSLNYFYNNDVYFTGKRLPAGKQIFGEFSNFKKINGYELYASGKFITPVHYAKITSNLSNLNIEFSPGIPSELLDLLGTQYVVRFLDQNLDDYNIVSYYSPDSNGLITGFSISSTLTLPSVGSRIQIGTNAFIFNLPNTRIMNSSGDGIGSALNSSLELDKNLFKSEKFFREVNPNNSELKLSSTGSQSFVISEEQSGILNKNLSLLRKSGDYAADYSNGIVYLSTNNVQDRSGGLAAYLTSSNIVQNKDIISVNKVYKLIQAYPDITPVEYTSFSFSDSEIKINDLELTTSIYDGSQIISSSGEIKEKLFVDENYEVITENSISSIRFIGLLKDIFGENLNSPISSERYEESNSLNLLKKVNLGGKNLYLPEYISYNRNIVDFKTKNTSKFKLSSGKYEIKFKTPDISSIFEIKNQGGSSLLDQALNFKIVSGIGVNLISEYSSLEYQVNFDSIDSNYSFNSGFDFISNGVDYWEITQYGSNYFIIKKTSEVYSQLFSEDVFDVIIRPEIYLDSYTTIRYPINNFITPDSLASISYITTYSPSPGTALAIDYSSGSIFIDYSYLVDKLIIYYEYGDNEIDWSINNSINEGQGYYVSYRYGALRSALRKNFGNLTSIPFFINQSLSFDRELYRDALLGTLSAFPKGPTIPAISGLVKSITKTTPKINELTFGSWILGRDYLHPGSVAHKGSLEFSDGKFGSGLKINNDNSIFVPSISNLSLEEGTLEMWISPDWHGINNDATLTFSFDNVGMGKWHYIGGDPFSTKNGYDVIGSWDQNDTRHGFDFSNGKLRIYKISSDLDGYTPDEYDSLFGIYKKNLNLTREIKNSQALEFSINYSYLPRLSESFYKLIESGYFKVFSLINDNQHNSLELNVIASTLKEDGLTKIFLVSSEEYDVFADFGPPYKTSTCKCSYPAQTSLLQNFDKLEIKISFDEFLARDNIFEEGFWSEDSSEVLMLMDNHGRMYEVVAFADYFGKKYYKSIPDFISDIYISRYPINYQELSGSNYEKLNDANFSSFVIIKKQLKLELKDLNKSSEFFNLNYVWNFNWNKKTKISLDIDPINNLSSIGNGIQKYNFFYTDLKESNLLSLIGDDVSSSSIALGVFGNTSANIYKNLITLNYKFDNKDIYIGANGINPSSTTFSVSRLSDDIDSNGISQISNTKDGIYVGYDSSCLSPINENIGQWILRARFLKYNELPYDVSISGEEYSNLLEYVFIDDPIRGAVTTSGSFSSITKGRRTISDSCSDTKECSKHFRFLGNKLLDSDGWSLIQESDSETINEIYGGREAESFVWRKIGEFNTENSSGIYRIDNLSSFNAPEEYLTNSIGLTALNSCVDGNIELIASCKISYFDSNTLSLSKESDVLFSGITVAEINSGDYNLGICLATDNLNNPMVVLIDFSNLNIIDVKNFNWFDSDFHKYSLILDRENSIILVYIDDVIYIQKDISLFSIINNDVCSSNNNKSFSIMLVDQRLINSENYFDLISSLIIDFNLVESNTNYNPGIIKLENSDLFIVSNDLAKFELHPNPNDEDLITIDGYSSESDIDEIMITSDDERFLIDSGISEDFSRISIFKDGKGFLNFRIIDQNNEKPSIHNIATNIKNFSPGERHHIAASWKLNTPYEKDEMHLFVDGLEVPSLFRFGGYAPIKFNSKFSDVSKENLWNYIEKKIIFPDYITDGIVSAGSNVITSASFITDSEMIGRSILFGEDTDLFGKLVIILEVGTNWVAVGDYATAEPYIFEVSQSNLSFKLAPYSNNFFTDIKNEKFSIFRRDCVNNKEYELSGVGYQIINGNIDIVNFENNFEYRYNKTSNIIEFVKRDDSCTYSESILKTDIDIHIKTYGLTGRRFKEVISLSSTSIFKNEGFDPLEMPNSRDGYSIVMTTGPKPKNISDVSIRKYILNNFSIPTDTITAVDDSLYSIFELDLSNSSTSLEYVNIFKQNDGRYLEILIDSDNIKFDSLNTLTIYGITPSGYSSEVLTINKNGSFYTSNRYLSLDKIEGSFEIIDIDMEFISILTIIEKNSIFTQDGSGDYAFIYRYSNGSFFIGVYGEDEYSPFELLPGYYLVDYSANLKVKISQVGEKLFIGTDISEKKPLLGTIDDFQILNTMLLDVRPWQKSSSGVRTVTEDFYKENSACITNSTLTLIDFENPINKQSRRLRNKKFLDTNGNFSYTLPLNEREKLLAYINNEEEFVNYMMYLGYSKETAEETYYECNRAEGGPLYNLAEYLPRIGNYFISPNSVNSSFGQAGRFEKNSALIINNNNNILRNSSGTIEFWYQPKLDTFNDGDTRVLFDSSSVLVDRFTSLSPNLIRLNNPASKIISIRLISNKKLSDSYYYSTGEKSSILFDEITTIESTGRYSKGTGVLKDFSAGCRLSLDGSEIILQDSLPGSNVDIIITYVPRQYSGERILIYKDNFSRIIAKFETKDYSYIIPVDIIWSENTWHRISLLYNLSSTGKFIKLFVDGKQYNTIYKYDKNEIFNMPDSSRIVSANNISLTEQFSQIIIGNNFDRSLPATGLIDNIRISRSARAYPKDSSGEEYDLNYSSNTDLVSPVKQDDLTTYFHDFDYESVQRDIFLANIIDPKYGIFDFEVVIGDDFSRVVGIGNGEVEDLIKDLVSRIKPAHSNGYVKFIEKKCKE